MVHSLYGTCGYVLHPLYCTCGYMVHSLYGTCGYVVHSLYCTCGYVVHPVYCTCTQRQCCMYLWDICCNQYCNRQKDMSRTLLCEFGWRVELVKLTVPQLVKNCPILLELSSLCTSLFTVCATYPTYLILFDHPNTVWWEASHYEYSCSPLSVPPLRLEYLAQYAVTPSALVLPFMLQNNFTPLYSKIPLIWLLIIQKSWQFGTWGK
jgi:hypothetical protein